MSEQKIAESFPSPGSSPNPSAAALFGLGVSPFAVIVGAAIAGGLMFKDPATSPPSDKNGGDGGHVPRSIVIFR